MTNPRVSKGLAISLFVCLGALCVNVRAQSATVGAERSGAARTGDFILAVVNQELVTAGEFNQRLARVRENAKRSGVPLPPGDVLRQQILESLIDERVQVAYARESGQRIDESELDRAVANVAAQNKVTMAQMRQRLSADGIDFARFRANIRDQMMIERVREREVQARIRISDSEIDALIEKQRNQAKGKTEYDIAQILVSVPERAGDAEVAERRSRADAALARVRAGEPFEAVAKDVSEDANRAQGGVMGMRPAERLPDAFVIAVQGLRPGEVMDTPLRSGAGFHVLKLLDRKDGQTLSVTQTRASHILLRVSAQLDQTTALARLAEFKQQIKSGAATFESLARANSEDGSAPQGGDLGWTSPGAFVPEFEQAMDALPVGGLSEPVISRFGAHLIRVNERRQLALDLKQQRDQARNLLREQKFEDAYNEWSRDLRARAYIELREPPP